MVEVVGGLRALTVEAGKHTVSTRYSPTVFWIGLVLTMLSWLGALVWLAKEICSSRKRPDERAPAAPLAGERQSVDWL